MTVQGRHATGEQMRILNGIYDELISRIHACYRHTKDCAGCGFCQETIKREQNARDVYRQELQRVFG